MKTLLSIAVALSLSVSAVANAGSLLDLNVIDRDTGAVLPTHWHDGKLFVAGTPGHRYAVRMKNRTGERVMAVLSVDGVNAISGKTASADQDGYVLDPYQATEIDGWRKSMSEVAEFNFTSLSSSYAAKTGRPDNVGVIGVAVFREKQPQYERRIDKIADAQPASPPASMPPSARDGAAAAQSAEKTTAAPAVEANRLDGALARTMPKREESLGTGHGAREESVVTYTNFERETSRPNEIDSVWYDSYNNLVARGVIVVPRPIHRDPQPFPNEFVPDPAG
ncbi:MAG TPA: hypothetical protein VHW73_11870 [Rudaea sp.]|jgi:hypothetical protein|nr:hypothetical protein [Rudaea sp.]